MGYISSVVECLRRHPHFEHLPSYGWGGVLRQKQHISYLVGHVVSMAMTMLHTPCIEYRVGVSDYTLSPCNIHNNKYNKCLMLLFVSIIVCRFEWMLDDGWKNGDTDRQMDEHSGRTFQYVTARICGELQNTLNSMSNVGVCPLVRCGRLTQFSFIGKVDVFLYFFVSFSWRLFLECCCLCASAFDVSL